jgi:phage/plasmid-like protein (TIGR03299 family)
MAHELEINNSTGEASFASFREPAWHGLGTVFTDEVNTSQMLELANLNNWNVRLEDVVMPSTLVSDKDYSYVVRDNPFTAGQVDVLGVVGERYRVLQNEELFSFGDNLLDGGGRWETAGSIKGGRQVFGSIALERETVLDPDGVSDVVKSYLLVNTSHDGSIAIQASVTPVRVVCANTLALALGQGKRKIKQTFKIRHTQTANGKVQAAREALGLATAYLDSFSIVANELFTAKITDQKFNDILLTAYPKPDEASKAASTRWTNKIDTLNDIYKGQTNFMIAGSAWGALNAMTERIDWYRSARGENTEAMLAAASGFEAATQAEKNRLFTIVKQAVSV